MSWWRPCRCKGISHLGFSRLPLGTLTKLYDVGQAKVFQPKLLLGTANLSITNNLAKYLHTYPTVWYRSNQGLSTYNAARYQSLNNFCTPIKPHQAGQTKVCQPTLWLGFCNSSTIRCLAKSLHAYQTTQWRPNQGLSTYTMARYR